MMYLKSAWLQCLVMLEFIRSYKVHLPNFRSSLGFEVSCGVGRSCAALGWVVLCWVRVN